METERLLDYPTPRKGASSGFKAWSTQTRVGLLLKQYCSTMLATCIMLAVCNCPPVKLGYIRSNSRFRGLIVGPTSGFRSSTKACQNKIEGSKYGKEASQPLLADATSNSGAWKAPSKVRYRHGGGKISKGSSGSATDATLPFVRAHNREIGRPHAGMNEA
jgi:hypothetical protein